MTELERANSQDLQAGGRMASNSAERGVNSAGDKRIQSG